MDGTTATVFGGHTHRENGGCDPNKAGNEASSSPQRVYRPSEKTVERIIEDALSLQQPPRTVKGGYRGGPVVQMVGPPLHDGGQTSGGRVEVVVHTGDAYGQGTTARVMVDIIGTMGRLNATDLRSSQGVNESEWAEFGQPVLEKLHPLNLRVGDSLSPAKQPASEFCASPAHSKPNPRVGARELSNLFGDLRAYVKKKGGRGLLDSLFSQLDSDGSGCLSGEELRLCLKGCLEQGLGVKVGRQEERVLLALLDIGREGPLPQDRFEASMKTGRELFRAVNAHNGFAAKGEGKEESFSLELQGALEQLRGQPDRLGDTLKAIGFSDITLLGEQQLVDLFRALFPEAPATTWGLLLLQSAATIKLPDYVSGYDIGTVTRVFCTQMEVGDETGAAGNTDSNGAAAEAHCSGRRSIFGILRKHFKKNRVQLDELWPKNMVLPVSKLYKMLTEVLNTRADVSSVTGRELRHVMAMLDVDNDGKVPRAEFESRMKLCRELHEALLAWQNNPKTVESGQKIVQQPMSPTWSQFNLAARLVAEQLMDHRLNIPWMVKELSSRQNNKLDAAEVRDLIVRLAPDLKHEIILCLMTFLSVWDTSKHALLTLDDLRRAFAEVSKLRIPPVDDQAQLSLDLEGKTEHDDFEEDSVAYMDKSSMLMDSFYLHHGTACDLLKGLEQSLPPQWWWQRGWSAEDITAVTAAVNESLRRTAETADKPILKYSTGDRFMMMTGRSLQTIADRVSRAIPRALALPEPRQWEQWHSNVILPERPSGHVQLGNVMLNVRDDWWATQWQWHSQWWKSSLQRCLEGVRAREGHPPPSSLKADGIEATLRVETRPWPFGITEAARPHMQQAAEEGPRLAALLGWRTDTKSRVRVPPTVVPSCTVAFSASLAEEAMLGDVCRLVVSGYGSGQPSLLPEVDSNEAEGDAWFLECIEVKDLSSNPPREWVLHHRGWLRSGAMLELVPDAHSWDEWFMGVDSRAGSCSVYLNSNLREFTWHRPPGPVLPFTPAAVPMRMGKAMQLREDIKELRDTWHLPPPNLSQLAKLRYLDEMPDTSRYSTHIRTRYPLGLSGGLGFGGLIASVMGHQWPHAIGMHARGGFRPGDATKETVMATWHLLDAKSRLRESYVRFISSVALDDSCLPCAAAPVVFSVIVDDRRVWQSQPVMRPGQVQTCNVSVKGATLLRLAVETAHSGSARSVWVDPHLLAEPLPPAVLEEFSRLAEPEVQERVSLARTRDNFALHVLPATDAEDPPCMYSVHIHSVNDKVARGLKANLALRLEGYRAFAPERIQTSTPWLEGLKGLVLQPGSRVGAMCTSVDIGTLTRVTIRASKKIISCVAAVEVVHATTGEVAFFVVSAASRKQLAEESSSSELTLTLAREEETSPLYRVVLYTTGGKDEQYGAALDLQGSREEPDPVYPDIIRELNDHIKWSGQLFGYRNVASVIVSAGSTVLTNILHLEMRMDTHKTATKVDWRLRSAEVVHLGTGCAVLFDFSAHLGAAKGSITRAVSPPSLTSIQRVTVTTSNVKWAGTDASVTLFLFGKSGRLLDQELSTTKQAMEPGSADVFFLQAPSLGELYKIIIRHDGSGVGADWHPAFFEVADLSTGLSFGVPCDRWVKGNSPQQLFVSGHDQITVRTEYHCILWLESPQGSLLDAAEAAELVGTSGSTTGMLDLVAEQIDWEVDDQYVDHLQALSAGRQAAGDSKMPAAGEAAYQITVCSKECHFPLPRSSHEPQLSITMHGWNGSIGPLRLCEDNFLAQDVHPFSSMGSIDSFQIEGRSIGQLLRVEIECHGVWGLLLSRVSVREQEPTRRGGRTCEFSGHSSWLGMPSTRDMRAPNFLRLLPVGCAAFTIRGKDIGDIHSLRLRHDSPGLHPGWRIRAAEVFHTDTSETASLDVDGVNDPVVLEDGVTPWLPWERTLGDSGERVGPPPVVEYIPIVEEEEEASDDGLDGFNGNPFSELREVIKTSESWPELFRLHDGDGDDQLSRQELNEVVAVLKPEWPQYKIDFTITSLDLGKNGQHSLDALLPEIKETRGAYRMAESLHRQLTDFGPAALTQMPQEPDLSVELRLLGDLAGKVSSGQKDSEDIFRALDANGSGHLSVTQQCSAIRGLHPEVTDKELRFLLSFFFTSDPGINGRLSLEELRTALAPFQTAAAGELQSGPGDQTIAGAVTLFSQFRQAMKASPDAWKSLTGPGSGVQGQKVQPPQLAALAAEMMKTLGAAWPAARADHFASVVAASTRGEGVEVDSLDDALNTSEALHQAASELHGDVNSADPPAFPDTYGSSAYLDGDSVLWELAEHARTTKGRVQMTKAWQEEGGAEDATRMQLGRVQDLMSTVPELQMPGRLAPDQIRFVLGYLYAVYPEGNGELSVKQLLEALRPFETDSPEEGAASDIALWNMFRTLGDSTKDTEQLSGLFARKGGGSPDGKLDLDRLSSIASELQPELMAKPAAMSHFVAMMGLGQPDTEYTAEEFKAALKTCRSTHKQVGAARRQLLDTPTEAAGEDALQRIIEYAGEPSAILARMASKLQGEEAEQVFKELDGNGNGFLDQRELCAAARKFEPSVADDALRFFLSYTFLAESGGDGPLSLERARELLEPFRALLGGGEIANAAYP